MNIQELKNVLDSPYIEHLDSEDTDVLRVVIFSQVWEFKLSIGYLFLDFGNGARLYFDSAHIQDNVIDHIHTLVLIRKETIVASMAILD